MLPPAIQTLLSLGPENLLKLRLDLVISQLEQQNLVSDTAISALKQLPQDIELKSVPVSVLGTVALDALQQYNAKNGAAPRLGGVNPSSEHGHAQVCKQCKRLDWYGPEERIVNDDGSAVVSCSFCGSLNKGSLPISQPTD